MGKILENPKDFFDSLSSEQFEDLLKEFGFKYKSLSHINLVKKYSENVTNNLLKRYSENMVNGDCNIKCSSHNMYQLNNSSLNEWSNILINSTSYNDVSIKNLQDNSIQTQSNNKNKYTRKEMCLKAA